MHKDNIAVIDIGLCEARHSNTRIAAQLQLAIHDIGRRIGQIRRRIIRVRPGQDCIIYRDAPTFQYIGRISHSQYRRIVHRIDHDIKA